MRQIEIEGKNVREAIDNGLKELGLDRDQVDVKVLDEGSTGLFGLMGAKPARVQITARVEVPGSSSTGSGESYSRKNERRPQPHRENKQPERDKPREITVDQGKLNSKTKDVTKQILKHLEFKGDVSTVIEEDEVIANVTTPDSVLLIGQKGATIDALEIIISAIVSREFDTSIHVTVDTDGYRARRAEEIVKLARSIVEEVRVSGKEKDLPPMNLRERKVVHRELQKENDIETFSRGRSSSRRITVRKKREH
ncbi:MAG: RNA-binding cell elongation regulator Jag/EloR [Elusimicrobiota bacterium]